MIRRDILRKAALAASVGVAGCSALQSGSEDANGEYELTTEDHLARAIGKLNTVALAIREFQNSENPSEATFDDSGSRDRLDGARTALGTAEESADTDAEEADIQAARAYATTMEGTVDAVHGLAEASTGLADARETLQAEEVDTEAASSMLERARKASSGAVDGHEQATSSLDAADGDRLQRLDAQYEAMKDGLDQLSSFVTGVDALTLGYDRQVTGISRLQTAEERVTAEEYDGAAEAFSEARPVFDESAKAFAEGIEGAADPLVSDLERGDKQSRSLVELASGYVNLLAGQDAISTAQTELEKEALDAAKESLATGSDEASTALTQFETGADILEEEFTDLFETARARAMAMQSLADGYTRVVDAREHISDAESQIDANEYDTARESLDGASTDSTAANDEFTAGQAAAGELFATEFETAQSRAQAIGSLSTGYAKLLDARGHITDAESRIENGEYDRARDSLQSGGEDATTADQEFEAGQAQAGSVFATEFETARGRATAVSSLSDGYVTLLDARDDLEAGESLFLDAAYEEARSSFDDGAETSKTAGDTFAEGERAKGADVFADAFERANQRAAAVEALSTGYATMVSGREGAQAGRDELESRNFDSAADEFETAGTTLDDAETTFSEGQEAADGEFEAEFTRALCQVGHLQSAIEHFQAAAEAGSGGNRRKSKAEQTKGDDDLDRVEDC